MPYRVCGHCRESVDHWTPNPMTGLVKCMACGWATEPECPECGWTASEDHDHIDVCDADNWSTYEEMSDEEAASLLRVISVDE